MITLVLVFVLPFLLLIQPVLGQLPPSWQSAIEMAREASEEINEMRKDLITDVIELYQ